MDLPQEVLDAAIIELVAPVAILVQPAHLAHEEVGNLWGRRNMRSSNHLIITKNKKAFVSQGKIARLRKNRC